MNIEHLYGVPSDKDSDLMWRLNEDRDEYVFNELLSKKKTNQTKVAKALKGKLSADCVIGSAGQMKPVKHSDAETIASFLRVPVEMLFITKGECRQRAREADTGTPIGGICALPTSGGCTRLG